MLSIMGQRGERQMTKGPDGATITVTQGKTTTIRFDLSQVIDIGHQRYVFDGKYLCSTPECSTWADVWWSSDDDGWLASSAVIPEQRKDQVERISIYSRRGWTGSCQYRTTRGKCNPISITIKNPQASDAGVYGLGVYRASQGDLLGRITIKVVTPGQITPAPEPTQFKLNPSLVKKDFTYKEQLSIETGFGDKNEWIEWVRYTTQSKGLGDCISCANPRPQLATVPLPEEETDLTCIIRMFSENITGLECANEKKSYPKTKMQSIPPSVQALPGNCTCFSNNDSNGTNVGTLSTEYCATTILTTDIKYELKWFQEQKRQLADVWWLCGDKRLRPRLPPRWGGSCALTRLLLPFYIVPISDKSMKLPGKYFFKRIKRETPQGSFDNRVYIDEIGVP
ncbi:uncharacterized protein [Aquarana catesbeiana]|uniref:uncharacterized protein isoform X2 n=1 Tax=Aquarana catesbeiana TaxID=8400 RepID=UPI003CC9A768